MKFHPQQLREAFERMCQAFAAARLGRAQEIKRGGRPFKDLTGQKFGKLTVRERAPRVAGRTEAFWVCECECGAKRVASSYRLRQGEIKHCGRCRDKRPAATKDATTRREPKRQRAPLVVSRGFDADERAAIDAAIAAGKVTRIERGQWPELGRPEVERWLYSRPKTPADRVGVSAG